MTNQPENGIAVKVVGALGVALSVTGAGITGSGILAGEYMLAGAGALLQSVGAGLTAAYMFLHSH